MYDYDDIKLIASAMIQECFKDECAVVTSILQSMFTQLDEIVRSAGISPLDREDTLKFLGEMLGVLALQLNASSAES